MGKIKQLTPAIRMRGVSYSCGPAAERVLADIGFSVPAGQWVGIAGANGSGKSTLLRLINGLLTASEGQIEINGTLLDTQTVHRVRQGVGIVFANPDNQFVGATVRDDIAFGLENRCLPREEMQERVERYAELLHIAPLLDRHPATLSGGQKQSVALAAVLAMEPGIIMFDEATSMLDEGAKRELLQTMRSMHASGRYTILCATHDTDELLAAERMLALAGGRIIGDGSPRELLRNERLLRACRLQTPYMVQLCRELEAHGITIGEQFTEEEVLSALWKSDSSKRRMAMAIGGST